MCARLLQFVRSTEGNRLFRKTVDEKESAMKRKVYTALDVEDTNSGSFSHHNLDKVVQDASNRL
ncbi:hypothetical protein BWQ96_08370 [Gracilariopsis chorda]|uniref:Uncharacterized protein n=1 Tax=Gracilariopsis chorda TaxID=448386 RepID=A0A2V3IIP3_9FLOR|nr:hypothetical protein BWQ96_08370 [Gracilariopsis chorda]|eukprot:PXF41918.1 hypothetical protein BWQ96_08370 [Gracilariopsis chorda]